jgi:hypothetical protein
MLIMWVITSEIALRFGGTYRLHLEGRILDQSVNQRKQVTCFLHGLLFVSEDGSNDFLRNVGLSPNYKCHSTEDRILLLKSCRIEGLH